MPWAILITDALVQEELGHVDDPEYIDNSISQILDPESGSDALRGGL